MTAPITPATITASKADGRHGATATAVNAGRANAPPAVCGAHPHGESGERGRRQHAVGNVVHVRAAHDEDMGLARNTSAATRALRLAVHALGSDTR